MDEDAEQEDGHNHVERNPQLHDERHARRDTDRDEKDSVLDRQQGENLRNRLLARHHQKQSNQQHRQGNTDEMMAHTPGALRESRADPVPDDGQAEAHQERSRDVQERLDLAVDADSIDEAHQKPGNQNRFQHHRDRRGHEELIARLRYGDRRRHDAKEQ